MVDVSAACVVTEPLKDSKFGSEILVYLILISVSLDSAIWTEDSQSPAGAWDSVK